MCGRFTMRRSVDELAERFNATVVDTEVFPSFNVAPTQKVAVVTGGAERELNAFTWGLVPFWAKDPSIGNRMINARAETVAEKPAFRSALAKRRCLIPADGFFEWKKTGGKSVPFYFRFPDDRLFAFAGIWEQWESPEGEPLRTCSLITVQPNALVGEVHDRMPAILLPDEESSWLETDGKDPRPLLELLHPYPEGELVTHPVSRKVNAPAANDPSCIEPEE